MPELFGNKHKFTKVPVDFYQRAVNEPDTFSRDDLGIPTLSLKPLFDDISKFYSCIDRSLVNPFSENTLVLSNFYPENKNYYIHLDGAEGGDGYGICMASLAGFDSSNPPKHIVKIELLGAPSRRTYGKEFKAEYVEDIVRELIDRKFTIKLLTYDRATIIRDLKPVIESQGGAVAPMSLDRCANYPVIDYDQPEPPYIRTESTQGSYFLPMTNFRDVVNRGGIIVPPHDGWFKIASAFEINMSKKIVTKIQGRQDDLGQACAGAVFHVLNNEVQEIDKKYLEIKDKPDTFYQMIDKLEGDLNKRKTKDSNFDTEPLEPPDEISSDFDNFSERINNLYYF